MIRVVNRYPKRNDSGAEEHGLKAFAAVFDQQGAAQKQHQDVQWWFEQTERRSASRLQIRVIGLPRR